MIVSVRLRSSLSAATVSSLISVEISLERLPLGPVSIASSAAAMIGVVAVVVISRRVRGPPVELGRSLVSVAGSVLAVMVATPSAVVVVPTLVLPGAGPLLVGLWPALVPV